LAEGRQQERMREGLLAVMRLELAMTPTTPETPSLHEARHFA